MACVARSHCVAVASGGAIYVLGGVGIYEGHLAQLKGEARVTRFEPREGRDRVCEVPCMRVPRRVKDKRSGSNLVAFAMRSGEIGVVGGECGYQLYGECFDPRTQAWRALP